MADNVTIRPSDGGIQVATDEVDGVHVPIYKTAMGDYGEVIPITPGTGLPVGGPEFQALNLKIDALIDIQQNMLTLMEAVFEDGISGRQNGEN